MTATCRVVDREGAGHAGVAVSDGITVVVTDADGRVELAAPDDPSVPPFSRPFVWVSRPDGYDADPWFVRRDALPADGAVHEFVLDRVEQPLPLTFAQVTDLHVSASADPVHTPLADSVYGIDAEGALVTRPLTRVPDLTAVLDEVGATDGPHGPPRFFVATGDLTDHGTPAEFALLAEALAASPAPVHVLPGNHDHYGHRTEPRPDDRPLDSGGMGSGTVTRYEEHVGPRWWSLTHAGLRLVAVDWFSHRLGLDRDVQERWLAADLATAPAGTPVLFLTHDQLPTEFFGRVAAAAPHVRIVGSLSGHWHTSRVVEVDGQLHANTGNATFGSFDWAPAHARLCGWDGERLTFRTVAVGGGDRLASATFAAASGPPLLAERARWAVRLPGAVHLARPARLDGPDAAVVLAWSDDDAARGGLVCHDVATGEERWRVPLDAPVRAGATWVPAAHGARAMAGGDGGTVSGSSSGTVVGVSVSGGVVAVDAGDGSVRWAAQLGDRTTAWVHAAPVVLDGAVAVGEPRCYAALDLVDGSVRWCIDRADEFENVATLSSGVVQGGTLVVPFSMLPRHTLGVDPVSGAVRWSGDGIAHHSPASDVVALPDGRDVVLARLGGRIERVEAASGEVRWAARVPAAFVTGRPLLVDDAVIVTTALGGVYRFDAVSGREEWSTQLPGDAVLAMGPYRRTGLAVPAGPTLAGHAIVQPTGDGRVHRLDAVSGELLSSIEVGAPITVPVVAVADAGDVIVATSEGTLARLGTAD